MRKLICTSIAVILSVNGFSQSWTRVADARSHAGKTLNLLGAVTDISYLKETNDYHILMQVKGKNTKQVVTLICPGAFLPKLADNEVTYLNQYIHVKGLIEMAKGKPQITVTDANQIAIVKENRDRNDGFEPL